MHARPNRRPARNCRGSMPDRTSAEARLATPAAASPSPVGPETETDVPVRVVVVRQVVLVDRGARIAADRDTDGQQRQPDGQDVGLVPGRRELSRIPEHGPEGEEDGGRHADGPPDRQPPEHPPGEGDVDGCEDPEDQLPVRLAAPQRHERQQHDRRQRRERHVAARHAVGRLDGADVVEAGVARARVHRPDRVADRRLALEERLRLPLEVVVDAERLGGGVHDQGHQRDAQSDRDRCRGRRPPGTPSHRGRVSGGL